MRPADDSLAPERNDRHRLAELYRRNVDDVYRYCLAHSGSPAAAEDAVAEAFLAAARAFADGGGDRVDRPWLFVVARRRMIDGWRAAERHRKRAHRVARWAPREVLESMEDGLAASDLVLQVLDSLPARQRRALILRYLDEHSVAEVAETMEISYQTAESLLARARRGFSAAWRAKSGSDDTRPASGSERPADATPSDEEYRR